MRGTGAVGKVIIHTHIPKTGGETTRALLETMLPAGSVYVIDQAAQQEPYVGNAHAEIVRTTHDFPARRPLEVPDIRAVTGHISYGWHSRAGMLDEWVSYVCTLRDPYQRVMSMYKHAKRNPWAWGFGACSHWGGFEDFLSNGPQDVRNGVCRRLSPDKPTTRGALRSLRKYDVVGFTAAYPQFAEQLSDLIGAKRPQYYRRNIAHKGMHAVSAYERALVDAYASEDVGLWKLVCPPVMVHVPGPSWVAGQYYRVKQKAKRYWGRVRWTGLR